MPRFSLYVSEKHYHAHTDAKQLSGWQSLYRSFQTPRSAGWNREAALREEAGENGGVLFFNEFEQKASALLRWLLWECLVLRKFIGEILDYNDNILQSLVTKGTRKFNQTKELEGLLSSRQLNDKLRRLSTLLLLPRIKTWTDGYLNNDAHLQ